MSAGERSAYDRSFYETYADVSTSSAKETLPLVLEIVRPASAVDVGCGTGTWLAVLRELGVATVVGVDGAYVRTDWLRVPAESFVAHDLRTPLKLPAHLPREFDLALSLETAEHLPAASAGGFVADLTRLAPFVLFSAAIPHQGGTDHVNEQWPMYWAEKFARHGFRTIDCLRARLWGNSRVAYYYAQNLLLFVREDRLAARPDLVRFEVPPTDPSLARVHPRRWLEANDLARIPVPRLVRALPGSLSRALAARLKGR